MEIQISTKYACPPNLPVLAIFAFSRGKPATSDSVGENIEEWKTALREDYFTGALGEIHYFRPKDQFPAARILSVGLGEEKFAGLESVRIAAAAACQAAAKIQAPTLAFELITQIPGFSIKETAEAAVLGARLSQYSFDRYKTKKKITAPRTLILLGGSGLEARAARLGAARGEIYAQATNYCRQTVDIPGEHLTPENMAQAARDLAKTNPDIRVRVFGREQLKKMGAGGILAVAQGSDHEPYLVHLIYQPKKKFKKKIALVGKAVTFDSGGLSLKNAESMATMKGDMAGAGAVLGAFSVLAEIAPACQVHGIFAAVENMPSGHAIRPGDVVQTLNGKTIEILNTDAEGRVTLADALFFAAKLKPDAIIDLATLTGACGICLGAEMAAVMSNQPVLANRLLLASSQVGDRMWELPLLEKYRKSLESDIADYNNTGAGRMGGVITAGLLLQEFVRGVPWAHIDIGYAGFAEKPWHAYQGKGATGYGTRTLLKFLSELK